MCLMALWLLKLLSLSLGEADEGGKQMRSLHLEEAG